VVLVVVDALRADHLGCYGYGEDGISPRIDALASDAARFEMALAPSPWTLPSLATLMTGLYPSPPGARNPSDLGYLGWLFHPEDYRPVSALHESRNTLAEILREAGFATAGFVQGSYPSSAFGVSQGFDVYRENATPGIRFDMESAFHWLDEERPERFFLYLHTIEVHSPYAPTEIQRGFGLRHPEVPMDELRRAVSEEQGRFRQLDRDPDYTGTLDGSVDTLQRIARDRTPLSSRDLRHLVALYDRGIAYTDYWVGRLIDGLQERGLYEQSIVVLTSDHGEEFLDHGGLEHGHTLYDEMLHVPLIVRVPGEGQGQVVAQQVGLVDVLPTLFDVLGIGEQQGVQGRSLRSLWHGETRPEHDYFAEASFDAGLEAVRTPRFKYVRDRAGREELYDLSQDPSEGNSLCPDLEGDSCAALRERLASWRDEVEEAARRLALPEPEPAQLDDALVERLRELGYVDDEG
jgi:arylsulfatase A-like enzyme